MYHRDGHDLHTRLRHELKQLTGQDLELNPCLSCGKLNTCQVGVWGLQGSPRRECLKCRSPLCRGGCRGSVPCCMLFPLPFAALQQGEQCAKGLDEP